MFQSSTMRAPVDLRHLHLKLLQQDSSKDPWLVLSDDTELTTQRALSPFAAMAYSLLSSAGVQSFLL